MIRIRSSCIATFVILASCAVPHDISRTEQNQDKAVVVARLYLQENHPQWYEEIESVDQFDITDTGTSWEVRKPFPKGVLGGGPVVEVDKNSLRVIRAYHEQ